MEKIKILANDGMDEQGRILLEQHGFEVTTTNVPQQDLAQAINEKKYRVVTVRSATVIRKDLIDHCPGLKVVVRAGVGMDNIDVQYATEHGITVYNTPSSSSLSVAELVFAHLFTMARMLHSSNRLMPVSGGAEFNALKKKFSGGIELRGKTLGIVGVGRIGQEVAKIACGCGMKVIVHDAFLPKVSIELDVFHLKPNPIITLSSVPLSYLMEQSDFITLHVPGGTLISTPEFEKMKKGVCVVNTARGGVIDEKALIAALNNGKVAQAALDVFDNEPTVSADILQHPQISLTPHIGASTKEAQARIGWELAHIIINHYER